MLSDIDIFLHCRCLSIYYCFLFLPSFYCFLSFNLIGVLSQIHIEIQSTSATYFLDFQFTDNLIICRYFSTLGTVCQFSSDSFENFLKTVLVKYNLHIAKFPLSRCKTQRTSKNRYSHVSTETIKIDTPSIIPKSSLWAPCSQCLPSTLSSWQPLTQFLILENFL